MFDGRAKARAYDCFALLCRGSVPRARWRY